MPDPESMPPATPLEDAVSPDALSEVLMAASSLMDPAAVATLVVRHVREQCDTDGAALYWWDDTELVLLPLAVVAPHDRRLHQIFHPGQGATGQAYATGVPVVANDYPSGISFPPAWKVADGVRAVAAVPLSINGEVRGVLTVTHHHEAILTDHDVAVMRLIGDQVAPMLHGMRALAHAQFRLAESRELTALIRGAAEAADAGPLLDRICELACRLLGSDFAGIVLPGEGQNTWPAAYGNVSDKDQWPSEAPDWPLLPHLSDGELLLLREVGDDPDWPLEKLPVIAAEGLRTVLALPMVATESTLSGGLILGWRFRLEPSAHLIGLSRTLAASATTLLTQASMLAALREGELLWRLTLDNAPVGLCLVQLDGTFRLVNAAMSRMLGLSEAEFLARNFVEVTHPSHLDDKRSLLASLVAGPDESGTIQARCLHADGHEVWTSISVQLVRNELAAPAYFSVQVEDISAQHAQTAHLVHLATHDALTGLANRKLFFEQLQRRLVDGGEAIVALIDVPKLHGLDDRFGHLVAGEIIREIGRRLVSAVGVSADDTDGETGTVESVARLASDEFAVRLGARDGVPLADLVQTRIVSAFDEPVHVDGRSHKLSVHVGVACSPGDGETSQELLHAADIALTAARREHRQLRFYTGAMGAAERHRQRLISDLRTALVGGDLSMVFQPIIDCATGTVVAVEALARWTHPDDGPIGPDTFVPLAEESGLMPELTSWALEYALSACERWQAARPGVRVAVNLSASDLQNAPTADLVVAALNRHHLTPGLLELELTESTVMTDFSTALRMLDDLSVLGVGLAVDDFGTGYSSLAYLQRLPMKTLKIDRSFVTAMLTDAGKHAIVTMIVQLAETLGMTTVAEGVEDDATCQALVNLRCTRLQGYGIARPMTEEALSDWRR